MRTFAKNRAAVSLAACTLALLACNGQDNNTHSGQPKSDSLVAMTADTPHVEVKVNKQYDDQGNLVAYDSSYVSIYSNGLGNTAFMDSIFRDFRTPFGQRYPFLNDPGFNNLFFNDSLLFHDFFHDDFFRRRMDLNQQYMDRMMREMDSLKNQWFKQRVQPPPGEKPARTI